MKTEYDQLEKLRGLGYNKEKVLETEFRDYNKSVLEELEEYTVEHGYLEKCQAAFSGRIIFFLPS